MMEVTGREAEVDAHQDDSHVHRVRVASGNDLCRVARVDQDHGVAGRFDHANAAGHVGLGKPKTRQQCDHEYNDQRHRVLP